MKQIKYILFFAVCTVFASCMGDRFSAPDEKDPAPFGNDSITETKVISINDLKKQYASAINNNSVEEITDDIQIKGYVTGNDVAGNLYNQISLQDASGAILISIGRGGLYGILPIGQQILVSLKGLKIGGYGQQPQIGGVYTNRKTLQESVGKLNRFTWEKHYKIIGNADPTKIQPEVFDLNKVKDQQYLAENSGKLMTVQNVRLKDADGKTVFAPQDGSVYLTANNANRPFENISSSSLVLRTSTYADFANQIMPTDQVNVTGIFTRFRNTWQILMRDITDIKPTQNQ